MDSKEFIQGVLRSRSTQFNVPDQDLLHATLGLITETGEFADAVKKHTFQGAKLDEVNMREELGDILWYVALACYALDTNFEALMQMNAAKLKLRYPDKFSPEHSAGRDVAAEREVLEGGDSDSC